MSRYNPNTIEPKWQQIWSDTQLYKTDISSDKPKKYILDFFPYPSGVSMHMGHVRNYSISDVVSRYYRMRGFEVLHPMGWDSFGLPAENHAIKEHITPREAIDKNTDRFREQFNITGMSYDWSKEIDSSDPDYYKWTQWFFLLLHKRGLAYRKDGLQNWCPKDKTVLANEQVIIENDAKVCERCGTPVEKKQLKQWFFKITDYADRLLDDLDDINWPDRIKSMQRNWIGKSIGAEVDFTVADSNQTITVFTTRPDTLFGATYMVLAPEHELVEQVVSDEHRDEVMAYVADTKQKTELQRKQGEKDKTGVFTGAYATNPVNDEQIPIWIADYVLMGYGTGAIMAVPAHDERDYEFATKFDLPIKAVIADTDADNESVFVGEGTMINSDAYNDISSADAREKIVANLEKDGKALEKVNYRMRDWLISRQRYWGAPIPIIHCKDCGEVPVPDDQLPVTLPDMKEFHPSSDGRGPLARVDEFVKTTCPTCGKPAQRETDTMDGFACSSWYFLRFPDPNNTDQPFDQEKIADWLPVDCYIGGAEHAVMHLLYARFWTKVIQDAGLIEFGEPFERLRNQGMLQAEDGKKISKRLGNYVAPEELVQQGYGADALRTTVLFLAPFDQETPWSSQSLVGVYRYLQRVWDFVQEFIQTEPSQSKANDHGALLADLASATHKAIKKVTTDLDEMNFNTAIAKLMELNNDMRALHEEVPFTEAHTEWKRAVEANLLLLAPFAPHMTEELWQQLGHDTSIHVDTWPVWDDELVKDDIVTAVVQVNGKVRANIEISADSTDQELEHLARENNKIASILKGKAIKKVIVVPGKLVNFVF